MQGYRLGDVSLGVATHGEFQAYYDPKLLYKTSIYALGKETKEVGETAKEILLPPAGKRPAPWAVA